MATRHRRDRSDSLDRELADLFSAALQQFRVHENRIALLAVGGYGRGELSPGSDLDIVILHDGKTDSLSAVVNAILYPLWDSGRAVDHAVRTPDEMKETAQSDVKVVMGALDAPTRKRAPRSSARKG